MRARSGFAAQVFFGSVLVFVVSTGSWLFRGAMPDLWVVTPSLALLAWSVWRQSLVRDAGLALPLALLWCLLLGSWLTSGEALLAATAAVPAVASVFLAVLDARAYFVPDPVPPPADPVVAERLRRAARPLWALAGLSLVSGAVLAWHMWFLAWPGITLGLLFAVLAWQRRRGIRRQWVLPVACGLAGAYVVVGALALGAPLWGFGLAVVLAFTLFVVLAASLVALPPKPPPVPSPEPNR